MAGTESHFLLSLISQKIHWMLFIYYTENDKRDYLVIRGFSKGCFCLSACLPDNSINWTLLYFFTSGCLWGCIDLTGAGCSCIVNCEFSPPSPRQLWKLVRMHMYCEMWIVNPSPPPGLMIHHWWLTIHVHYEMPIVNAPRFDNSQFLKSWSFTFDQALSDVKFFNSTMERV